MKGDGIVKIIQRIGYALLFIALAYVALHKFVNAPVSSDHSPDDVLEALATLDIRKQPGEPGTTAEAAGGILPEFRMVRSRDFVEWKVMSGDLVTMTMTARVEPGWLRGSWVKAEVARGDAPDSRTSPAFRSEGITLGLFKNAIGDTLDLIGSPGWGDHCDAVHADMLAEDGGFSENPLGIFSIDGRLKEQGCDMAAREDTFQQVSNTMGKADGAMDSSAPRSPRPDDDAVGESGFKVVSPY